jgi:hypothetical protein
VATKPENWLWQPRLADEELVVVSRATYGLTVHSADWIHRRVETLTLVDERSVKRHLSVDFTLPASTPTPLRVRTGRLSTAPVHLVPITWLLREPGPMRFDVRDEDGNALPLLVETEQVRITAGTLIAAAETALRPFRRTLDRPTRRAIGLAVSVPPSDAVVYLRSLLNMRSQEWHQFPGNGVTRRILRRDPTFVHLLCLAARSSVAVVPLLNATGRRRVIKLSFEQSLGYESRPDRAVGTWSRLKLSSGVQAVQALVEMPVMGGSGSQHVQVLTPANVEFTSATLTGSTPRDALHQQIYDEPCEPRASNTDCVVAGPDNRAHLYAPRATRQHVGYASLRLRAERRGMLTASLVASLLIAAVLVAMASAAGTFASQSNAAASMLLLAPALAAAFLIRGGEHAMARLLLRPTRLVLAIDALLPFAAAIVLLAFTPDERDQVTYVGGKGTAAWTVSHLVAPVSLAQHVLLGVIAFLAVIACAALWALWLLPRPDKRVD